MRARQIGPWWRTAVMVLKPLLLLLTRRRWEGFANLPASGGVLVVANHVSVVDPLTMAHGLYEHGRLPSFMAKSVLFDKPGLGAVMRGANQIPVYRGGGDAAAALSAAEAALATGSCVVLYPEGTTTRDPALWPMRGRTGVARLALATDVPVVPLVQWGPQRIYHRGARLKLWPPALVQLRIGPPLDLEDFRDRARRDGVTPELLREMTDTIVGVLRAMVGDLRGEEPPAEVYDPGAAA